MNDFLAPLGDSDPHGQPPWDWREMLLERAAESEPTQPSVDVVLCVGDPCGDVRACLWALLRSATRPFHLILVEDGCKPDAAAALRALAEREPKVELIRNEGPGHGFEKAVAIGLQASSGAFVALLDGDTIVSPFWLERMVACAESDSGIGVVVPVSNAIAPRSQPAGAPRGGGASGELPPWLTVDAMALLVAGLSSRERPMVTFFAGNCFALTRAAIERLGGLDRDRVDRGGLKGLEARAREAGLVTALADDAYVLHRRPDTTGASAAPDEVRRVASVRVAGALLSGGEEATVAAFRGANPEPLEILFVVDDAAGQAAGALRTVCGEARGLRRLGVPVRIAVPREGIDEARKACPDVEDLFVAYAEEAEPTGHAANADVVLRGDRRPGLRAGGAADHSALGAALSLYALVTRERGEQPGVSGGSARSSGNG